MMSVRALAGFPPPSLRELQRARRVALRQMVRHAYERVPYYRRLFDRHGISPKDVRHPDDLRRLPITTRQDLQRAGVEDRLAEGVDRSKLEYVRTSGSTGEPLTIVRTGLEARLALNYWLRPDWQYGCRPTYRKAWLKTPHHAAAQRNRIYTWLKHALGLFRFRRLNCLRPAEELLGELRQYRPDVLGGMPSMLYRLAESATRRDRRLIQPHYIRTGGDTLTPAMRRRIGEVFGATVRMTYGSHEFSLIGWECPTSGHLHTCDDALIVEVLKNGRPAQPGERGELVATNLLSYSMPFIRYRLADVVTCGPARCACGAPFSVIEGVEGRAVDFLQLPGGARLHPFTVVGPVVYGAPWVAKYQLVQHSHTSVSMLIRPLQPPGKGEVERLEEQVRNELPSCLDFSVRIVDRILQSPDDKLRLVRSELDDSASSDAEPADRTAAARKGT